MAHRPLLWSAACLLLGAHTVSAPSSGNATPQPEAARLGPPQLVLEAGEHRLDTLLDVTARHFGRNHVLQDALGANMPAVRLQTDLELDAESANEVLSQLTYTMGFVMTPLDVERGLWEWIHVQGPRRHTIYARALTMSPDEVLAHDSWLVPVATAIPLRTNSAQVANVLRPFFVDAAQPLVIGSSPDGGTLFVRGIADQVAQVVRLVQAFDGEQAASAEPERPRDVRPPQRRRRASA